jgi:hypothetical protein
VCSSAISSRIARNPRRRTNAETNDKSYEIAAPSAGYLNDLTVATYIARGEVGTHYRLAGHVGCVPEGLRSITEVTSPTMTDRDMREGVYSELPGTPR